MNTDKVAEELERQHAEIERLRDELQLARDAYDAEHAFGESWHADAMGAIAERDALRAELAALREQEPVAYTTGLMFRARQSEVVVKLTRKAQPEYGFTCALYAAPVAQDVPTTQVTDEQIDAVTSVQWGSYANHLFHAYRAYAREILKLKGV